MFNLGIAAILALVICGTLVIIAVPTLLFIRRKIARCTSSVPGTFMREAEYRMRRASTTMPVVSYELDGTTYEVMATYAEGFGGLSSQPAGTPLTVHYDPKEPTYIWVSKSGTFGQLRGMTILLWVGVGGCVLAACYMLFLYMTR